MLYVGADDYLLIEMSSIVLTIVHTKSWLIFDVILEYMFYWESSFRNDILRNSLENIALYYSDASPTSVALVGLLLAPNNVLVIIIIIIVVVVYKPIDSSYTEVVFWRLKGHEASASARYALSRSVSFCLKSLFYTQSAWCMGLHEANITNCL